jgi:hypothetical protein
MQWIDAAIQHRPKVASLDPAPPWFDAEGLSRLGDAGGSYYRDDDHASNWGAERLMRSQIEPVFVEMLRSSAASR